MRSNAHVHSRPKIVAIIGDAGLERARVTGMLRSVADQLLHFPALDAVDTQWLHDHSAVMVLLAMRTPTSSLISAVRHFRSFDPGSAIIICVNDSSQTLHQLAALARAGLDDMLFMSDPDTMDRLKREVARRLANALPVELIRQAVPEVNNDSTNYCAYCFRHGFRNLRVEQVADWFRCNVTTLNRHLRAAGLRSIEHIIDFGRALHAAHRLDATSAPIASIVRALEFPTAAAFSRDVRRWIGHSPSKLREIGASNVVLSVIAHCARSDADSRRTS